MNRTEYKNNFGREHYERINLAVPKGMKDIIKALASDKVFRVSYLLVTMKILCVFVVSYRIIEI